MPHDRASRLRSVLACALVAALGVLVYARTLGGGFIADDEGLILRSPRVHSLRSVPGFFVQGFAQERSVGHTAGYYRPVVSTSFALDYATGGGAAWAFHLTNVLVYAACCGLVCALLLRLLTDGAAAVLGSALFACLAVHTEAVAWISGRTDLLALAFMLAAALCLLGARQPAAGGARTWRPAALLCAAFALMLLALMSKEVALALLPMWIAFELTLGRRGRWSAVLWRRCVAVGTLALACGVYLAMRRVALGALGTGGPPIFRPWTPEGLATIAMCVWQYLGKLALPVQLSFGFEVQPFKTVRAAAPVLCLVGAAGLGGLTLWAALRRPAVGLALLWTWLGLAPALNFVPITETAAERFLMVPSVGFCLLMALAVSEVRGGLKREAGARGAVWVQAALAAVAMLALAHGLMAAQAAGQWRTQRSLYLATMRSSPASPISQDLAGLAYGDDPTTPERAVLHFRRALELSGGLPALQVVAHDNLGRIYAQNGRLAPAMMHLGEALRLNEGLAQVRGLLALVIVEMARTEGLPRAWELARGQAERALKDGGPDGLAYVALACRELYSAHDPEAAGALFEKAARLDPARNLAAQAAFEGAVRANPRDARTHYQLALVYARQGKIEDALRAARAARRIEPTPEVIGLIEELERQAGVRHR